MIHRTSFRVAALRELLAWGMVRPGAWTPTELQQGVERSVGSGCCACVTAKSGVQG